MESFIAVISANGEESLFRSEKAKVTHKLCGKPMISWVTEAVNEAGAKKIIVSVEQNEEQVASCVLPGVTFADRCSTEETCHAFVQAMPFLKGEMGICLFACADNPLITSKTIKKLIENHRNKKSAMTILTDEQLISTNEILKSHKLNVPDETRSIYLEQLNIKNAGTFCIEIEWLEKVMRVFSSYPDNPPNPKLKNLIMEVSNNMGNIGIVAPNSKEELLCVNDRIQLFQAQKAINCRIIEKHMKNGVTFHNPENCIVEGDVVIGSDTIIYPGTLLSGSTSIGDNCVIGPDTTLNNVCTGNNVTIFNSVAIDSSIGDNSKVGPFAYLRPESKVGRNVKIGDFVEIKKSCIGDDTKISHLTYVGDAEIGENVNLGCGVVIVNYDGQNKNKTIVGDNSFIGCNANLISPVEVEQNAFIAAGSTITDNVPEYSLAIARSRQTIIKDWVLRKGRVRGEKTDG